jgi:hypothetical protein
MTLIKIEKKKIARIFIVTAVLLLIPLTAMQFTDEVVWGSLDFLVAGALLFLAQITYELIAVKRKDILYKAAAGLAVATGLFLIWANLAVGIIGDEGNPANLMYYGVIAVGIIGVFISRFRPLGMAWVFFITALAQMLAFLIAVISGWDPEFMIHVFFVFLWILSALLFQLAARRI